MSGDRETIAYLRQYADAAGTLAELAMNAEPRTRYVVWYDADENEYVVARQWYEGWRDGGTLLESEVVRSDQFPTALEHAHDLSRAARS